MSRNLAPHHELHFVRVDLQLRAGRLEELDQEHARRQAENKRREKLEREEEERRLAGTQSGHRDGKTGHETHHQRAHDDVR